MRQEVLRMERVTYKEQGVTLLEDFDLNIFEGEIMGLLPLNAFGLSAFLNLLSEQLPLYDGYIYVREKLADSCENMKKTAGGISIIRDKSSLVDGQNLVTNIFVLRHGFRKEIINSGLLRRQLRPFLDDIGIELPLDVSVEKLSVFERVVAEILKAVVTGNRLIVMQEIGALISDRELVRLHEIMRHYTKQGFSFLYISPHFEEILQVCKRAAIMSNGRIIKILHDGEMNKKAMQTCSLEYERRVRKRLEYSEKSVESDIVLRVEHVCGRVIRDLNFVVYKGECLVIQSLEEEVFKNLKELIIGEDEEKTGKILLDGREEEVAGRKIAVIMEQPSQTMLFPDMSYMDNLCISVDHREKSVWRNRKIRRSIRKEYGQMLGEQVFEKRVKELTEIEKTELVYARILLQKPKLVFCIQPFKGADMMQRMRIWELQEMMLKKGISVVILAVNMADSLALANRVIRIDQEGTTEYRQEDFETLPVNVPWKRLYEKKR